MIVLLEPLTADSETLELVRAVQDGDRDALGLLIQRFERSVYAMALRRLSNHAEAQELAQEVFVQVLRKIDQLREPERFAGWLRSITVRMAINRLARRRRTVTSEPESFDAYCVERSTPFEEVIAGERRQQVRDGLERLRPMDRDTLVAFYVEGQSLVEMSVAFESPVGTIKRRLHMARKRLARELEEVMAV